MLEYESAQLSGFLQALKGEITNPMYPYLVNMKPEYKKVSTEKSAGSRVFTGYDISFNRMIQIFSEADGNWSIAKSKKIFCRLVRSFSHITFRDSLKKSMYDNQSVTLSKQYPIIRKWTLKGIDDFLSTYKVRNRRSLVIDVFYFSLQHLIKTTGAILKEIQQNHKEPRALESLVEACRSMILEIPFYYEIFLESVGVLANSRESKLQWNPITEKNMRIIKKCKEVTDNDVAHPTTIGLLNNNIYRLTKPYHLTITYEYYKHDLQLLQKNLLDIIPDTNHGFLLFDKHRFQHVFALIDSLHLSLLILTAFCKDDGNSLSAYMSDNFYSLTPNPSDTLPNNTSKAAFVKIGWTWEKFLSHMKRLIDLLNTKAECSLNGIDKSNQVGISFLQEQEETLVTSEEKRGNIMDLLATLASGLKNQDLTMPIFFHEKRVKAPYTRFYDIQRLCRELVEYINFLENKSHLSKVYESLFAVQDSSISDENKVIKGMLNKDSKLSRPVTQIQETNADYTSFNNEYSPIWNEFEWNNDTDTNTEINLTKMLASERANSFSDKHYEEDSTLSGLLRVPKFNFQTSIESPSIFIRSYQTETRREEENQLDEERKSCEGDYYSIDFFRENKNFTPDSNINSTLCSPFSKANTNGITLDNDFGYQRISRDEIFTESGFIETRKGSSDQYLNDSSNERSIPSKSPVSYFDKINEASTHVDSDKSKRGKTKYEKESRQEISTDRHNPSHQTQVERNLMFSNKMGRSDKAEMQFWLLTNYEPKSISLCFNFAFKGEDIHIKNATSVAREGECERHEDDWGIRKRGEKDHTYRVVGREYGWASSENSTFNTFLYGNTEIIFMPYISKIRWMQRKILAAQKERRKAIKLMLKNEESKYPHLRVTKEWINVMSQLKGLTYARRIQNSFTHWKIEELYESLFKLLRKVLKKV